MFTNCSDNHSAILFSMKTTICGMAGQSSIIGPFKNTRADPVSNSSAGERDCVGKADDTVNGIEMNGSTAANPV